MKHVKLFEEFISEASGYDSIIVEPGKSRDFYKKLVSDLKKDGHYAAISASGDNNHILINRGEAEKIKDLIEDKGIKVLRFSNDGGPWPLQEGRIALNHVYANAPVRNKVLEILKNGKVTEEEFMAAVSKAGAPSKWINRNSHFFKIEEEDGVKYYSLSKSGQVIMSALNESEDVEDLVDIYEEYGLEENLVVDPLDLTSDFFYVSINGKVYGYQAKPGGNIEDVATTFKKMLKYSAGKALAWLKKNSELGLGAKGSGPVREGTDVEYWTAYNDDTSGQSSKKFSEKSKDFEDAFEEAVSNWQKEAEDTLNSSDIKKIRTIAQEFFKKKGWISVNIIQAMIAQS
jgi:hypothetical protein